MSFLIFVENLYTAVKSLFSNAHLKNLFSFRVNYAKWGGYCANSAIQNKFRQFMDDAFRTFQSFFEHLQFVFGLCHYGVSPNGPRATGRRLRG